MKRWLLPLATLFWLHASAQSERYVESDVQRARNAGGSFIPVRLLEVLPANAERDALWSDALRAATVVRYDGRAASELLRARQERITLELPTPDGVQLVDLIRAEIFAPGFQVSVSSGGAADVELGAHYRGVVRGVPGSLAAISIFPDAIMGLISGAQDEQVLGPVDHDPENRHVLYRTVDLREVPDFSCGVMEPPMAPHPDDYRPRGGMKTIRCVSVYWEAAYDIYQNKGSSVPNVTSYLTGLFNQMATIYSNDGVQVQLSEIFVWTSTSPYNATSSSGRLNQFGSTRTSFNGDLAHLLDLANYGGVAWLNTLCAGTSSRMAYSGIDASYNNVPTYSWSVMVVAHETGHNLGSPHTHNCSWNGNGTAIDGCGPTAGYTEGSCPNAGLPPGGGTVMSYCHLIGGTGINLALGFGPQPKALIINRVNSASCLAQCGTSCDPPEPLSVTNLTAASATLTWANFGVSSYTLRWRAVGAPGWTNVTGIATNSYAVSGLAQETQYEFQVLSVCSASSSAYSTVKTFTTPVPCIDAYEPNNSTAASTLLTLPASVNALMNPSGDADYFRFTLATTSNVNISMSQLPADFDVRLLNSGGAQVAVSQNGGTSSEYIYYANATAGNYYIHVYGYNGANNPVACYLLNASAYAVTCSIPQGLSSTAITYSSATINWVAAPGGGTGGTTYDLRWKPSSSGTWTNVNGLSGNTYPLSGLTQLTSYDVQVRSVCGGVQGTMSEYSTTHTFTTLQAPCDVVPRSVVAAKVFLEGPYKTSNSLMTDSLRKLNLIPLTQPYTAMGHTVSGPTTVSAGILAVTGSNAVVDWVLVELRANSSPYTVLEARAGLLQRDGDIVAPDGSSPLGFCPDAGTYRVAVRHRNHFGAMTANGIALSSTAATVDFSLSGTAMYGTGGRKTIGSVMALWAGNVDPDNWLLYTGQDNDRDPILTAVGGSVPTNTVSLYSGADVNMDGTVKYTGQDNDRDPILTNVGGSVPTNSVQEQLP